MGNLNSRLDNANIGIKIQRNNTDCRTERDGKYEKEVKKVGRKYKKAQYTSNRSSRKGIRGEKKRREENVFKETKA